jgi:nicotinamidase-related amidase
MKPTLLIIDPQNDFFAPDNPSIAEFRAAVATINDAISLFRENHWPIVFVQHSSRVKPMGSPQWAIYKGFDCHSEEARLYKTEPNAFWETELESLLKVCHIDLVVVAGFLAEQCVLSTYRGAIERGFHAAILEDAIASLNPEYSRFVREISQTVTMGDLRARAAEESARKHREEPLPHMEYAGLH